MNFVSLNQNESSTDAFFSSLLQEIGLYSPKQRNIINRMQQMRYNGSAGKNEDEELVGHSSSINISA